MIRMYESWNLSVYVKVIIIFSIANIIQTGIQFTTHYLMMMRWYKENPMQEERQVRSIKVGLAPDGDVQLKEHGSNDEL